MRSNPSLQTLVIVAVCAASVALAVTATAFSQPREPVEMPDDQVRAIDAYRGVSDAASQEIERENDRRLAPFDLMWGLK